MPERVLVLLIVLAAATAFGVWRLFRDGRLRPPRRSGDALGPADLGDELGPRATFVQFSSPLCQPCRATHRVLHDVAGSVPGVAHVDVDVQTHADLVRRLGVMRTPTVLLLDARGQVRGRASGPVTAEEARGSLAGLGT